MSQLFKPGLIIILLFILQGCQKENPTIPVVNTKEVAEISYTSAISGGEVTDEGGVPVTTRGLCWSINALPSISDNLTAGSGGAGEFSGILTPLIQNTTYFVRSYATNSVGTGYGNQVSFVTRKTGIPTITTTSISSITGFSATSGGNIPDDNGELVNGRGICWGTDPNPTTNNSKTIDGSGTGSFTSSLISLKPGTKYYVRSYATNSNGTAYGNEITFTTSVVLSVLTTTPFSNITSTSAETGGNISDDGGAPVTERGICWNTSQNPVNTDKKLTYNSGTGVFIALISGLKGSTTYYARAYATTSAGVAYGNEISFTTNPPLPPVLITKEITNTTTNSVLSGGTITNDGGSTITARGVCWNSTENPTISDNKTSDGLLSETFQSSISGLDPNKLYYLRSYATHNTGTSYGNEIIVKTYSGTVTDIDGNRYFTTTIGNQTWMAENLKTTRYNNGDLIGTTTPATLDISAETTPRYQWAYAGNESNVSVYGRLYTWFAATDNRKVCPAGWHLASDAEWTTMEAYLNANGYNFDGTTSFSVYNKIGKSLSAAVSWRLIGIAGSIGNFDFPAYRNKSGFTALPGGIRRIDGLFNSMNEVAYYWTGTEIDASFAYVRNLYYSNTNTNRIGNMKSDYAFSLRCIAD